MSSWMAGNIYFIYLCIHSTQQLPTDCVGNVGWMSEESIRCNSDPQSMGYNKGKEVDNCCFNTVFTIVYTVIECFYSACKASQECFCDMEGEQQR